MDVNQVKTNIKRFLSNPNTLTFILVIILIIIIYFVYNYLVNKAISPVSVPYAINQLQAKDEITSDDVGTVKISGNFVTASGSGLIQSGRTVVGKYVANGYQIPKNSFFYTDAVASESEAATTEFSNIPDGYTIYRLPVTFHSTYGCSIMEGDYIDLYFKAKDVNGTNSSNIIYGLFIKSIQVLKVVDKDGNDVFTNTDDDDQMVPKYIEFAVPIEYFTLLRKASLIPADTELIPVPRNAGYSENPEDTTIASEAIENFILALSSSYGIE